MFIRGKLTRRLSFFASHYPNCRLIIMIVCLVPFLAGVLGLWLIPEWNRYGRLACLWISFAYTATWTLSMSVATANTAGHTKKITTNAMLIIGYCLGNFVGPFFFRADEAPRYTLGVAMMLVCVGLQILCLLGILALLWSRNRSRREEHAPTVANEQQGYERSLSDETDLQNKYFKVSGGLFCVSHWYILTFVTIVCLLSPGDLGKLEGYRRETRNVMSL